MLDILEKRKETLQKKLEEKNLDAVIITSNTNRAYISGFAGSAGYAVVTREKAFLLTDFRYTQQATEQAKSFHVIQFEGKPFEFINQIMKEKNIRKLGFEDQNVTFAQYAHFQKELHVPEMLPIGNMIVDMRKVKDASEIEKIRKAAQIADQAYTHILTQIKPGITEFELALELEFFMRKNGAQGLSFDTIAVSGERSSLPHGQPTEKKIQNHDLLTLDFGCIYEGYCSDMTRTVAVGGIDEKQKKIYDIVLEAQLKALEALKPGKTGKEVDQVARDLISGYGYGKNFGHGLGHSVGMEIHEEPRLSPSGNEVLVPGMIATVEPGIYIEGFGGVRIEDLTVIKETGIENLTSSKKELMII